MKSELENDKTKLPFCPLPEDLHHAYPQMKGFSPRNLKYMRAFAEAYPDMSFVQTVSAQMTWSHNVALLDKVKESQERVWYMQQAIEHGWSLNILEMQIRTRLYQRKGKATASLPEPLKDQLPDIQTLEARLQKVKESIEGEEPQ